MRSRSTVAAALIAPSETMRGGLRHLLVNTLLAGLLVLLLVFPSELFNSTYDHHHERIEAAFGRLLPGRRRRASAGAPALPAPPVRPRPPARGRATRRLRYGFVVLAGALLAGLLDPHAGLDATSAALFIGVVLSTVAGAMLGLLRGRSYRRARHLNPKAHIDAVPSGLAVAGACVLVSRLTGFEPGYLYGLLGGFAFAVAMEAPDDGRDELAGVVLTLAIALVAWIVFVPVSDRANQGHPGFAVQTADSFLAALFIGGIEGLFFGLAPLKFLPGYRLSRWSWWAWAMAAAVVSGVFVFVLLNPSSGYLGSSTTASVVVTYGLFIGFGLGSVLFWGWFRLRPGPESSAEDAVAPVPDHGSTTALR